MWRTEAALECVLSVGIVERTIYEKTFLQLGLTATLFTLWLSLYNM